MEPATIESKLEHLQPLIKDYVLKRLPESMDADDVIQETMIFCWKNPSRCSGSFLNAETCRFINEKIYEMSAPDDYISETPKEDIAYFMDDDFYRLTDLEDIKKLFRKLYVNEIDRKIMIEHICWNRSFQDIAKDYIIYNYVFGLPVYRQAYPDEVHDRYRKAIRRFRNECSLQRVLRKPPFNGTVYYKIEGRD